MIRRLGVVALAVVATSLTVGVVHAEPDDAPAPPKPWLAQPHEPVAPAPAAPVSPWRAGGIVVVLGLMAGAGFVLRGQRRRGVEAREGGRLLVLDQKRVGAKAHLVVASVGGRTMLLGVTEGSVRRIAWLPTVDAPAADESRARTEAEPPPSPPAFSDTLKGILARIGERGAKRETDPALLLADETRDVVEVSRSRALAPRDHARSHAAIDPGPIEGQASGLARRLEAKS